MSKFENPVDIPAGHTVYVAKRGLEARHVGIMTVDVRKVTKRTPTGYKLENIHSYKAVRFFSDATYYISTERADVARALLDDCRRLVDMQQERLDRLREREAVLSADVYGEDHA